jgi:hypothetical protein
MKGLAMLLAVMLVCVIGSVSAQMPNSDDVYVVQEGDVLYTLEGNYSGRPWQWSRLVEMNSFLKDPGRTWTDEKGRIIVLIRPGEELRGLGELGIIPQPLPLEQLKNAVPASAAELPVEPNSRPWLWWLLALAALALAIVIALAKRNPVTAGPAVISGGVSDETAARAFRDNCARQGGEHIEIREIVRGRLYGAVRVRYGDNRSRLMMLWGDIGYRALVRRNNGVWNEEYMLQACGNDLRSSGARYIPGLGFRFVPETIVERPAEATQAESTASQAPAAEDSPSDPATDEGENKHFTFKPATGTNPNNLVQFKGFSSFEVKVIEDGTTVVRFK